VVRTLFTLGLLATAGLAQAQDHVFAAQETGLPGSSYVVSETGHASIMATAVTVSIPAFEKRSARESRWMMCVYTNLALIYHRPYWAAVYPQEGGDTVTIGFPASNKPEDLQALGPEFVGPRSLKNIMSVETMKIFCGKMGYQYKYLPAP
jgi:hypothetical protein